MRKNIPESLPAFKDRLLALTDDIDPEMPDTTELERLLRDARNTKMSKGRRQEAVNLASAELAYLLLDEQAIGDYITLLELIVQHDVDGAAVMQELQEAFVYVWPAGSSKEIGPIFRAKLKKRWGFKKLKKKTAARRLVRDLNEPMF